MLPLARSAKLARLRIRLSDERAKLITESAKDEHLIANIENTFWNADACNRAYRLREEGRLVYHHGSYHVK